ncbi:phosphoribosylaminoimidazole carboxylase [Thiohalorhabdus denitrificans]|uniref:N5-carboxyaminoimidazole ribonucleotide synthase n=1 Tax=Thiohalorhabdus denitrificans TaxID=381306 RepID=A0A0P9E9N5_9GAMM|nr:5-(carboxyamino)imidazole ribonucleotide synthase [Thiohalorhabdus denitrificans]KPV39081.1 phosphoribosylaminoimidazole carboxylase [Thiohalorhabdus denitrificans]SCX78167.1 5-(carboxyamino)imidazole ribonucleotide synthase [Thiohalorhabdus denitrificans]
MRVGILGGGQLGRMLALAGHPLGLETTVLDPGEAPCGAAVAAHLRGEYDDLGLLRRLAEWADVVTYEFEQVPEAAPAELAGQVPVHPGPEALATGRDRLNEKTLFRELGIPTARFAAVDSRDALKAAVADIGLPAVLKTRTLGYDGKGQAVLREDGDVDAAWNEIGGVPLILEEVVPFEREVSMIAVRGADGAQRFYPLAENHHEQGILLESRPRPADPREADAVDYAARLLERLDYVGTVALELFDAGDRLLANEMAPRVHNSGHWTIEGAETSQFENHLRAVCGLPLGATDPVGHSAMLNLIGVLPERADVLAVPGAHLHFYGKDSRPGRKVGHITVRADSAAELEGRLERVRRLLPAA